MQKILSAILGIITEIAFTLIIMLCAFILGAGLLFFFNK